MAGFNSIYGKLTLLLIIVILISSIGYVWQSLFSRYLDGSPELTAATAGNIGQTNKAQQPKSPEAGKQATIPQSQTNAVWGDLLASFQAGETAQIGLENALIEHLRNNPNSPLYNEIVSVFRQGSLSSYAQQVLVSILGEVNNYQAAETLITLVNQFLVNTPDVETATFLAIQKFSPESWREHSNAEMAPVFEAAWQTDNADFLPAIANVMATIGTPATLDIFIETLTSNTDPKRVSIVQQAMTNLANPALIPELSNLLETSELKGVKQASGNALAHMGELGAATDLFKWSSHAGADEIGVVNNWMETAMNTTPEFIDYLDKNLDRQSFKSTEIKQKIKLLLDEVKKGDENVDEFDN
jgi:hypothetical protein